MSSTQENLRTSKADDQPDVNISLEELLAELDKEILPPLEPGDITRAMLAEQKGVTENTIKRIMAKRIKSGEWLAIPKRGKYSTVMTYRKAER